VDAVRDELATVRCARCREELDYAEDWYDTPGESERGALEHHITSRHAENPVEVREQYLRDISAIPNRFRYPPSRPTEEPAATVWNEAAAWYRDCICESNLILYGGTGVGKTTLAARIALRLIQDAAGHKLQWASITYWLHVGDFARRARRLLATGKSAELAEILDRGQQADCLVLDDLGSERPTEFVRDLVADLIEYRYDSNYGSTVVTTNYTPDELAARLGGDDPMIGDRLVGRLCEDAFQLHFQGRDRRLPDPEPPADAGDREADVVDGAGNLEDAA
jgi:DNA replication protein DnaC